MPKHEKGTPKEIANRCKSKGLQKLKWYCEMCRKQCRDENGFKCHLTSEAHQRQLLLFAENENSYLREFSREFEANFMHILRHTFGTKRIRANQVYQEYIKDKGHVHMNSTTWHTLTGFVQYLGKSGKCRIDENEKGWHIQYIDQEEEMRRSKAQQRAKQEKNDEERMLELMQRQIDRAHEAEKLAEGEEGEAMDTEAGPSTSSKRPKEFVKAEGDAAIKFNLAPAGPKAATALVNTEGMPTSSSKQPSSGFQNPSNSRHAGQQQQPRRSALDELREEDEKQRERRNRRDYWLHEGIVVKIVTSRLGPAYHKAKGRVVKVNDDDPYSAHVELDNGTVVKVDQQHVETVVPALGREMLIVNGGYRGERAVLEKLLEDKYALQLRISKGTRAGRMVEVAYEDASKTY